MKNFHPLNQKHPQNRGEFCSHSRNKPKRLFWISLPKKHHQLGRLTNFDHGHHSNDLRLVSAIALGLPYQLDS